MMGSLLVTGGGGFVRPHAARFYASQDWKVVAFDNLSREELLGGRGGPIPPTYNWERLRPEDDVSVVRGDIRQLLDVKPRVEKADAIIHAAGQVAVTTSLEDPRTDFEVNLLGYLERPQGS